MTPYVEYFEGFHAGAAKVLEHIRAEGLKAEVKNGVLYIGPRSRIDDDLRLLILDHKPELTALVAVEDIKVAWRAGAMLRQLKDCSWPCSIPTLFALPAAQPSKEDCKSCGELLDVGEGDSFICGPCSRAKHIALDLWMQRPAQSVKAA